MAPGVPEWQKPVAIWVNAVCASPFRLIRSMEPSKSETYTAAGLEPFAGAYASPHGPVKVSAANGLLTAPAELTKGLAGAEKPAALMLSSGSRVSALHPESSADWAIR